MAATRPYESRPRRTMMGSLAAFGSRRMLDFARWRARREARVQMRPSDQVFRGFIQINVIRLR
jgi:hypothetical protein